MKTKEELKQLKEEYEMLTNKLRKLTDEELKLVTGGTDDGEYKYVLLDGSKAYLSSEKTQWYSVIGDIRSNNIDDYIHCKVMSNTSSRVVPVLNDDDNKFYQDIRIKEFLNKYEKNGGHIFK